MLTTGTIVQINNQMSFHWSLLFCSLWRNYNIIYRREEMCSFHMDSVIWAASSYPGIRWKKRLFCKQENLK